MQSTRAAHVLDEIPFTLDIQALLRQARVQKGSDLAAELLPLAAIGEQLARPKACYLAATISSRGDGCVEIEGVRLTSTALRAKVDGIWLVFPYLATCGQELQAWEVAIADPLHRYWADVVKDLALKAAMQALNAHIDAAYQPGATVTMRPGMREDWPIGDQRPLFDLLGDCVAATGVYLTDSMLMIPNKSLSGIRIPTEGEAAQ